jgi:hypothetical protein
MNGLKLLAAMFLSLAVGYSSPTLAQAVDIEPNDTCLGAQAIGAVDGSFTVSGSLDTPPDDPDVDFFRFEATPGAPLIADLVGVTLGDPFLGLFDSACNLLAFNDDFSGLNSRLRFVVPDDGDFVLAASSFFDDDFNGDGCCSGAYELTVGPAPPAIGSITGRVVNSVTEEPLPGDAPPFAAVELLRSLEDDSLEVVSSQSTDSEGRFRFEQDFAGDPIAVGTFQVRAFANEFQQGATELFEVAEGQDVDVGDIPLTPPPIFISEVQPCSELLPQGGTCEYSARVFNTTSERLTGLAWSPVDGFSLGSSLDFTLFEASKARGSQIAARERVSVSAFGDQILRFQFEVPSFVAEGATFCTRIFLGLNPGPLVNTVDERSLFCITKSATAFEVMAEVQSQKILRSVSGKSKGHVDSPPMPE